MADSTSLNGLIKKAIEDRLKQKDISGLISAIKENVSNENPSNPIKIFKNQINQAIGLLNSINTDSIMYQWKSATKIEDLEKIAKTRANIIVIISQAALLVQKISDVLKQFTDEEAFAFVTIEGGKLEIYTGSMKNLLQNADFLSTLSVGRYALSRSGLGSEGGLKLGFSQASLSVPLSLSDNNQQLLTKFQSNGEWPTTSAIQQEVKSHQKTRSFVLEAYARSMVLGEKYQFRQDSNPFYGEADIQGKNKEGKFVRYSVKTFKNYKEANLQNIKASFVDIPVVLSQLRVYQKLASLDKIPLDKEKIETLFSNKSEKIKNQLIEAAKQKVSND